MPAVLGDIRSLLFVPGHDERKLAKALDCGADALIIDLEDSVPQSDKDQARATCADFVRAHRERLPLFVRVNDLSTGRLLGDLAAVVRAQPRGIVLPKCSGGRDVALAGHYLTALEARDGVPEGWVQVLAIATETAASLLDMKTYAGEAGPRLCGMLWGGEDLSVDLGASANHDTNGAYTQPFQWARNVCLFGATAAGVAAVDAVYIDYRDLDGLRKEAVEAAAAGFGAKAAVHPAQVPIINEIFPKRSDAVRRAEAIVAAFAAQPGAWSVEIDGRSFDRAFLNGALRFLESAKTASR